MKDLKGTKTERNLQEAFAGESMARNKYSYFASKARKDGYEQIAVEFVVCRDGLGKGSILVDKFLGAIAPHVILERDFAQLHPAFAVVHVVCLAYRTPDGCVCHAEADFFHVPLPAGRLEAHSVGIRRKTYRTT